MHPAPWSYSWEVKTVGGTLHSTCANKYFTFRCLLRWVEAKKLGRHCPWHDRVFGLLGERRAKNGRLVEVHSIPGVDSGADWGAGGSLHRRLSGEDGTWIETPNRK